MRILTSWNRTWLLSRPIPTVARLSIGFSVPFTRSRGLVGSSPTPGWSPLLTPARACFAGCAWGAGVGPSNHQRSSCSFGFDGRIMGHIEASGSEGTEDHAGLIDQLIRLQAQQTHVSAPSRRPIPLKSRHGATNPQAFPNGAPELAPASPLSVEPGPRHSRGLAGTTVASRQGRRPAATPAAISASTSGFSTSS